MSEDNRVHEDAHEAFVEGEHPVAEEIAERVAEGQGEEVPVEEEPTEADG